MKHRGKDEDPDAGEHAVNDRGRNSAKPLSEFENTRSELHQASEQNDDAEHLDALLLDQLPNQNGQSGGRTAHLQWRARQKTNDNATYDPRYEACHHRHARRDRNAHTQGQSDEEDDNGSQEIAAEVVGRV